MIKKSIGVLIFLGFFTSAFADSALSTTTGTNFFINNSENYMIVKYELCPIKGSCPQPVELKLDSGKFGGQNWFQLYIADAQKYKSVTVLQVTEKDGKGNILATKTFSDRDACYSQHNDALVFDDFHTKKYIFCIKMKNVLATPADIKNNASQFKTYLK